MASGLLALFDDVAAFAKIASASLDDVVKMSVKEAGKSAGIVIDDAAVTPRYVVGFTADRELPIIGKIARGSAPTLSCLRRSWRSRCRLSVKRHWP